MGVRTIEESVGVEGKFFNSRTGSFKLTDPECITAVLDLMEAITSIPRKRIRIMDVRYPGGGGVRVRMAAGNSDRKIYVYVVFLPLFVRLICGQQ